VTGEHAHIHGTSGLALSRHSHQPKAEHHGEAAGGSGVARWPVCKAGNFSLAAALLIGIVHGPRGFPRRWRCCARPRLHDPRWGVFYLLIFGLGTIAGMMLITVDAGAGRFLIPGNALCVGESRGW